MMLRMLALAWLLLGNIAQAQDTTLDVTEDGLVRAPSSRKVGVYRAPNVPFHQYRRIHIGEITVQFRKGWERTAKQSWHVSKKQLQEIRDDMATWFREELEKELVKRGGYAVAETPTLDTLRITATVLNLEMSAPLAGKSDQRMDTLASTAGSMKMMVELFDGTSGAIIGRVIEYYQAPEYLEPRIITRISNTAEFSRGFAEAAQYTHEAIEVAKTERSH
jgi:Protein of unknown function (DUF3313)